MENKKITGYIQYALKLKLKSPLCVSSGDDFITDCDIQRNYDGVPFVPGTSLAGAIRGYLQEINENVELIDRLFGYSGESVGNMSKLQISDMYFSEEKKMDVVVRDGIKLEDKLTVKGAKFDMEAIDTEAEAECYLLLTIREEDNAEELKAMVESGLSGMGSGEICLGANKNRGFGRLEILECKRKEFNKNNIMNWLNFQKEDLWSNEENNISLKPAESRYITIKVPLRQQGGISIRRYSVVPGTPDYEHITANKKPVIPGTSWNGAIRGRVYEILEQFVKKPARREAYINQWFGYVKNDSKANEFKQEKNAWQSNIIIEESEIDGGVGLVMTRNRINRFDASAVGGALYTEKSHFNGNVCLTVKVRKNYYNNEGKLQRNDARSYEPIVGLLLIAIKDIQNGFLAVGGQTAVGRGIFKERDGIELEGTDKDPEYFICSVGALLEENKNESK